MNIFRSTDLRKAYATGGFRERYAMEHGNQSKVYIRGHKCYKYTYSKHHEYQDANGATYDTITGEWIN